MRDLCSYDYAIIRVVPRVEREEFLNVGVIVSCQSKSYLAAQISLDEQRLHAFDARMDVESLRANLNSFELIAVGGEQAGPIGQLNQRERFHWLVAPRSTIIQTSPVHSGRCTEPSHALQHLLNTMVRQIVR